MIGRARLLLAVAALSWPAGAAAQDRRTDDQIWASLSGTVSIGRNTEMRADGLLQFVDDGSRVGRRLVRVVALVRAHDRLKLGGGYVWTELAPTRGARVTEHRAVQEIDLRTSIFDERIIVAMRTQIEERWRDGRRGTSVRLRQLSRLQAPIRSGGPAAVFWNEYFHELRETPWSGTAGPSLMLNFAGLHLPVTDAIAIEPGYLNQRQFDRGPDRIRHVAALFARVAF